MIPTLLVVPDKPTSSPHPTSPLVTFLTDPYGFLTGHLAPIAAFATTHAAALIAATTAVVAAVVALRFGLARHRHARLADGAVCVTVLAPPDVEPHGGEALWAQLSGLLRPWWQRLLHGQPHLAFEYTWNSDGMTLHLWVPAGVPTGLVRRAAEAAWPGAHTRVTDPPPLLPAGHRITAGRLRLARPEVLALRTGHDRDPLRALLQAAVGLRDGETACVQVLARPATGIALRRARRTARRLKAGDGGARLPALVNLAAHRSQHTPTTREDADYAATVRQAAIKLAGPHWQASVVYAATCTPSDDRAAERTRGRAHALASAFSLFAERNWLARTQLFRPARWIDARRFPHRAGLLSVPELAALAHLPTDAHAPGLARAGARSVLPPPAIPAPSPAARPLGTADSGPRRPVALATTDARQHVHLMGATGSGKSTLINHLVLDDIRHGRGAIVLDPKGDLIVDLLARLPEHAVDKLVLIDPDDPHAPPCLNVLDGTDTDVVVDNITGIFRRIFTAFWGPRTDDLMRATCLTLLHHRDATGYLPTLADIPRLLAEPAFRLRLAATLKDPVLRGFWAWYESMSEPTRAAVVGPVMNKLRAFLLRDFARRAIAAGPSTFDMTDVLDGGILLARLPKGALGEETSRLIGSFIVARAWQAAAARTRTPERDRIDASLYLDECHNFLTLPYPLEDMLAEARGYRLSLTLAHQNLAQLPRDLREGISANARNKVFFNASPEDSASLERHTAPLLTAHDLANLGPYQATARLLVSGAETPAFTLTTTPLPPAVPGRPERLRTAAAEHFGAGRPKHRPL
ncbi:type IV secretory system conjugative DNA transfer family protein [Streptomyces boninensis]|uniref:type IV secretory system conjugative DNA transfer family protein n=1 Tax=Streptomyces boninensis TaxID=2039455 RepID=UPI003B20CD02